MSDSIFECHGCSVAAAVVVVVDLLHLDVPGYRPQHRGLVPRDRVRRVSRLPPRFVGRHVAAADALHHHLRDLGVLRQGQVRTHDAAVGAVAALNDLRALAADAEVAGEAAEAIRTVVLDFDWLRPSSEHHGLILAILLFVGDVIVNLLLESLPAHRKFARRDLKFIKKCFAIKTSGGDWFSGGQA